MKKSNICYSLVAFIMLLAYMPTNAQAGQNNQPRPAAKPAQNNQPKPGSQPQGNQSKPGAQPMPNGQVRPNPQPMPPNDQPRLRNQQAQAQDELEEEDNLPIWKKNKKSGIKEVALTSYMAAGGVVSLDSSLIQEKLIMKFDDNGNIIEKHVYNRRGVMKMVSKYDEKGRDILDSVFRADSIFDYTASYKYNATGTSAEYKIIKADGNLMTRSVRTFNSQGHMTEENGYDRAGKPTWTLKLNYDDKENPVENIFTNTNQLRPIPEQRSTSKYNDKGYRIEKRDFVGGKLQDKIIYTYDDKDNIISKITIYQNGNVKIDRNEYTYDNDGNWVLKTESPNTVVVQDITK